MSLHIIFLTNNCHIDQRSSPQTQNRRIADFRVEARFSGKGYILVPQFIHLSFSNIRLPTVRLKLRNVWDSHESARYIIRIQIGCARARVIHPRPSRVENRKFSRARARARGNDDECGKRRDTLRITVDIGTKIQCCCCCCYVRYIS